MATHRETRTIQINEELDLDPLELAREFYEANGYAVDLDAITSMELPPEEPREDAPEAEQAPEEQAEVRRSGALHMTRGKPGGGWWTSDMTELHATLRLTLRHTALMATCEVDTSGQHFTGDDIAYWKGELDAAAAYVQGEDLTPRDLRPDESARARSRSRSSYTSGLYGMFVAAFVIVSLFMAWQFYIRLAVAR